jgi:methyl-accepting chemotaxis protein
MQLMDEGNPYVMAVAEGDARGVSILWSVFFHYIDAGNLHVSAGAGRLIAGIIGLFGLVLFNGLLVSTILNWTARRKEQWDNGEIRYPLSSLPKGRFAVVVGANEMAVSIVKELLQIPPKQEKRLDYSYKQGNEYVILQTCSDVSTLRERLSAQLTDQELDRVICYRALRNSQKEIEQLYDQIVKRSAEIDRICENIKNLENKIIETNTNISRLEVELNDNIYECQRNINDVKMITDYLSEHQEDIESTNDLYHISLSQIEKERQFKQSLIDLLQSNLY